MTYSKPFSDYEPLKRSSSRKSSTPSLEDETTRSSLTKSASEESPGQLDEGLTPSFFKVQIPSVEPNNQQEKGAAKSGAESLLNASEEKWILKKGHSLSFAGVFLFTALVYFRPYEYFPSLSWLSTSTFWVAIATLLIFLPTQLGLENRITARPREVNLVLLLLVAGALSIPFALDPAKAGDTLI